MYVLDVIALSPTSPAGALSYRSKDKLVPGTIVSILLRKTPVHGIVVSATEVKDAKEMLKNATFALVKSVTRTDSIMPKPFMQAAERIAQYHAVTLGAVLHALLSDSISLSTPRALPNGDGYEKKGLEFPTAVRLRKYRALIEDTKKATVLVVPTMAELARVKALYADLKPLVLSGEVKAEDRKRIVEEAVDEKRLVITTPAFSFVFVKALGQIIVERPSAGSYRMPRRPYLDWVAALSFLAQMREVPFVLGDYPLPLEHRPRVKAPLPTAPDAQIEYIDAREQKVQGETWKAIPDEARREIERAYKGEGRIAVLAARKGYSPSVVCRDCGNALKDAAGRALSLASVGGKRILRSADGTSVESAKTLCPVCGSWNLMPLGVAVERVYEELNDAFPDIPITRFDADTVKTDVQARKAMKQVSEKGGIIIGTEAMLPWLYQGVKEGEEYALSVVASMDSFLSLPLWRARERFVRVGLLLAEASKRLMVHTRLPDDTALSAVLSPKTTAFFEEEADLRKALKYPPFGTLIAFTAEGSKKRLVEAKIELIEAVLPLALTALPERFVEKTTYRQMMLLHVPEGAWPNGELSTRLQHLPPYIKITIDPESFW